MKISIKTAALLTVAFTAFSPTNADAMSMLGSLLGTASSMMGGQQGMMGGGGQQPGMGGMPPQGMGY